MIKKINFNSIVLQIFLLIIIAFLLLIFLFPLYYLFVASSLSNSEADNQNFKLVIEKNLINNFLNSINESFYKGLLTSFLTVLSTNFFRLTLYTLGVFGLWFASKKFKNLFYLIFIVVSMIPEVVTYVGLAKLLNQNSTISNAPVFSLITNQFFSFFNFFYLYKSIKSVPIQKTRIAKIDNLNFFQIFKLVFFPKLKVAYFLIIIFSTIQVWNDFLWPIYIFANKDNQTISTWFSFTGQTENGFYQNVQAAGSLFATIVPIVIYLAFSPIINKNTSKSTL